MRLTHRFLISLAVLCTAAVAPAKAVRDAPQYPARLVLVDYAVTGAGTPRSWLGPVYAEVLCQRLRQSEHLLVVPPVEQRQQSAGVAASSVEMVTTNLLATLKNTRADYVLGGLLEDKGEKIHVVSVIAARVTGRPMVVDSGEVTLDKLFRSQADVIVQRLLPQTGQRFTADEYKAMSEYDPKSSSAVLELVGKGWRAWSSEAPEPSMALWREALKIEPHSTLATEALGQALVAYHRQILAEARDLAKDGVIERRHDAEAHFRLAEVLSESGEWEAAADEYEEAAKLRNAFLDAYLGWGYALLQEGHIDKAAAIFDSALLIDPRNARAYYNRGVAAFRQGKLEEARRYWDEGLKRAPDDPLLAAAVARYGTPSLAAGTLGPAASPGVDAGGSHREAKP
jgi:tetratricopeptide (TPR) repeat protein